MYKKKKNPQNMSSKDRKKDLTETVDWIVATFWIKGIMMIIWLRIYPNIQNDEL